MCDFGFYCEAAVNGWQQGKVRSVDVWLVPPLDRLAAVRSSCI